MWQPFTIQTYGSHYYQCNWCHLPLPLGVEPEISAHDAVFVAWSVSGSGALRRRFMFWDAHPFGFHVCFLDAPIGHMLTTIQDIKILLFFTEPCEELQKSLLLIMPIWSQRYLTAHSGLLVIEWLPLEQQCSESRRTDIISPWDLHIKLQPSQGGMLGDIPFPLAFTFYRQTATKGCWKEFKAPGLGGGGMTSRCNRYQININFLAGVGPKYRKAQRKVPWLINK